MQSSGDAETTPCNILVIGIRAHKYLRAAVDMAPVPCRFWLTATRPKPLIATLGDVFESGKRQKKINLA